MGRTPDGDEYSLAWTPPDYTVGDDGKRVGYVNTSEPNNWGRWGADDQRGTANFITPDKVAAAAQLIRTGQTISCAVPLAAGGPDLGLTLGEAWWLEDLAEACVAQKRWEFFIAAPPLNITNAVGSPLNPTAVL